jgi:hypothetical protein
MPEPMVWDRRLVELKARLAHLYNTEAKARVLVDRAGLQADLIDFHGSSMIRWHDILSHTLNQSWLENVVDAALEDFPDDEVLSRWSGGEQRSLDAALGRRGINALRAVLDQLQVSVPLPERWDRTALRMLRDSVIQVQDNESRLVLRMIDDLSDALSVTSLIRRYLRDGVTTGDMRRSLARTLPTVAVEMHGEAAIHGDVDYVERIALEYPARANDCRQYLVAFALRLDVCSDELARGLRDEFDYAMVNDVRELVVAEERTDQVTMVVSLHSAFTDDWPEEVHAWLLEAGGSVSDRTDVQCLPTKDGVEDALYEVLEWASARLGGAPPRHIDVALPTSLLARWRPEEAAVPARLGIDHDVVVRWSHRLSPPPHVRSGLRHAMKLMEEIQKAPFACVHWLEEIDVSDPVALIAALRDGRYRGALGLRFVPIGRTELLDLLLLYSPIVLWPSDECDRLDDIISDVTSHWASLPVGFAQAYREKWHAQDRMTAPALADVLAVWDDMDWLRFCGRMWQHRAELRSAGGRL